MQRRRPGKATKLSNVARFLQHACAAEGLSQTELADRVGIVSAATVSRWLNDKLGPRDDDLRLVARAIRVPPETLWALRVIDATGSEAPMLATSGAFYHLATGGGTTLLLAGLTMLAGTYFFREIPLGRRTLLVATVDPEGEQLRRFEEQRVGRLSGSMALAWLTSLSVVAEAYERSEREGRVRFWTRSTLRIGGDEGPVEIAANDWVAVESYDIPGQRSRYEIHFYGDECWQERVAPLMKMLKDSNGGPQGEELIWDSLWARADPRRKRLANKIANVQRALSALWVNSNEPEAQG